MGRTGWVRDRRLNPVRRRLCYVAEMFLVGLTGGIGAGKSTVSQELVARGAVVIDADAITRDLQAPGSPVLAAMVERFGEGILQADGTLDRPAVASIVFNDAASLADLNAIVHPAVAAEIAARLQAQVDDPGDPIVVLDVPLLVESGRDDMEALIVVDADPDVAVQRLVEHRGFSEADARARITHQASRKERLAKADFVVDNNGTREVLTAEMDVLWRWIEARRELDRQEHPRTG